MALMELKGVTKDYGQGKIFIPALRGVDLAIDEGEFMAIAGPSGSGKTTLFNIVSGLDRLTTGTILFDGQDITRFSQKELAELRLRRMGFVFQAYNLIPVLTALENVEFVMMLQGVPADIRRAKSKKVLDEVGLSDFYGRRPLDMSGGQQQRVAVARAIAAEPKLILADEPTANLDSATAIQLLDIMRQLNREKKITFLFSTHDQRVMDKADRLVQIRDGMIVS